MDDDRIEKLRADASRLWTSGPTRVVTNADGIATTAPQALMVGVQWDVIFVRDDGWSLGAPFRLEATAEAMWMDQWVAVLRREPDGSVSITIPYPNMKGLA